MHVNHEKNALCDGYVIVFSYDSTESYMIEESVVI